MYDIKFIFKAKKLDRGIDKYQVYVYFLHWHWEKFLNIGYVCRAEGECD